MLTQADALCDEKLADIEQLDTRILVTSNIHLTLRARQIMPAL